MHLWLELRVPNRFCGMRDLDYFGNGKRDVCKNSERVRDLIESCGKRDLQ